MQPDDLIGQRVECPGLPVNLAAVFWFAGEHRLPVLQARWPVSPIAVLHAPSFGVNVFTPAEQRAEKGHLGGFVRRWRNLANFGARPTADRTAVAGGGLRHGSGMSGERVLELFDLGTEAFVVRQSRFQGCLGFLLAPHVNYSLAVTDVPG